MLKFYYHPSPNPAKIALYLEETGLDYEMVPVDTRRGEQHELAWMKESGLLDSPHCRRRR